MKYVIILAALLATSPLYSQTYFLNGMAQAVGNDCYQLTDAIVYQNGTVWYGDQIDLNEPFDIQMLLNFGNLDADGADGICFVLQTVGTSAIGQSGGGMGYLNFGTSLGIEFDTWRNPEYADLTSDHIAIEKNGDINHSSATNHIAGPIQMDALDPNVEDGEDHVVRIVWNPTLQQISVYFDCVFRLVGTVDLINDVFNGQNLVYWGFTAATGGSYNVQTVCLQENILNVGETVAICPGSSIQLSAANSSNGTYTWTPATYLDNPNSATPIATPPSDITYTVTFTDLCGNANSQDVSVSVEPLEVDLAQSAPLTCHTPQVFISSESNFDNLNYSWSTADGFIQGSTSNPMVTLNSPGTYVLNSNYQNECFASDTLTVESDFSDFNVTITGNTLVNCTTPTTTLSANGNLSGINYLWTTNDGSFTGPVISSNATVNAGGTYTVAAFLNLFCNGTYDVVVEENFTPAVANAGNDVTLNCYFPETELSGQSASVDEVLWTTSVGTIIGDPTSLTITASSPGNYTITSTNPESGCTAQDVVTVGANFLEPLVLVDTPDSLTCIRPEVTLNATISTINNTPFATLWTSANSNVIADADTNTPTVFQSDIYTITVVDTDNGCSTEVPVAVLESEEFDFNFDLLSYPDVLTPNADGLNNGWRPFLISNPDQDIATIFSSYHLQVFDRWGNRVYETTNQREFWEPSSDMEGVFYYTLEMESNCGRGASITKDGYIHLLH
ncbi:MAG: lectin-like domain-containing protein [Flavobacteriales bacterium]